MPVVLQKCELFRNLISPLHPRLSHLTAEHPTQLHGDVGEGSYCCPAAEAFLGERRKKSRTLDH